MEHENSHSRKEKTANFRFYYQLNDLLPLRLQSTWITYNFTGRPSVKDAIEAIGIPHTEVDVIFVNGMPANFSSSIHAGDFVEVYPVFSHFHPYYSLQALDENQHPAFVLDVHLGKLAKDLRLLGFDAEYDSGFSSYNLITKSVNEGRIILSRDRKVFKNNLVSRGYLVRSEQPFQQLLELCCRFPLIPAALPFSRCLACNGKILQVQKEEVADRLEPKTIKYYHEFYRCESCGRIYWKGSHLNRMKELFRELERLANDCAERLPKGPP